MLALAGCSRAQTASDPGPQPSTNAVYRDAERHERREADLPHESDAAVDRWCLRHDHACVVYVPTPQKVVDKMLTVAKLQSSDVLYDLGCGDGRIVVTAARTYGGVSVGGAPEVGGRRGPVGAVSLRLSAPSSRRM